MQEEYYFFYLFPCIFAVKAVFVRISTDDYLTDNHMTDVFRNYCFG